MAYYDFFFLRVVDLPLSLGTRGFFSQSSHSRMKLLVALLIAAVALASAACGYDPESYFIVDGKAHAVKTSPLVDYVLTYDSNYNWFDTNERMSGKGWTGYLLNLTSQAWMADITSRPVWSHNLLVIRPDEINEETNIGSIYVTGENNSDEPRPPKELSADIVVASMLALKTKSTVAILYNIPNQAMAFRDPTTGDFGKTMQEDNLVAYTWNEYVRNTTRAEQVIYIPMTKAVFAAMDAVTDFTTYSPKLFPRGLSKFVIAGASKRGATTWLTAVVDAAQPAGRRRVEGIVPIVFDAVNFTEVIGHMFQNLNGWSFAFEPYRRAGVTELIANPKGMETLSCVIDPIKYDSWNNITRALVVSGTGDEFFQVRYSSSLSYFWPIIAIPAVFSLFFDLSFLFSPLTTGFGGTRSSPRRRPSLRSITVSTSAMPSTPWSPASARSWTLSAALSPRSRPSTRSRRSRGTLPIPTARSRLRLPPSRPRLSSGTRCRTRPSRSAAATSA
jgi:PhoPQ-activated pathogenicity-related protein